MKQLVEYKNKIRDFFRRFDEILTPIFRFIFSLLAFFAIRKLFPYHDLAVRTDVCVLLSVICAILPDGFMVFMVGILITLHSFTVSFEVGLSFVLLFMFMYLVYIKFFPKCGMAIMLTVILYLWDLEFAVPFIVAIFAGVSGAVPSALGVMIYYFGKYTEEVNKLLPKNTASDIISSLTSKGNKSQTDSLQFMIDHMLKNREMFAIMGVFIITIVMIGVVYNLNFKYSQYIGLAAGAVANVFAYIYMCFTMEIDANLPSCIKGILLGLVVVIIVRFFKGFLDYPHTERVTFEDDEYFYYVKAVPKLAEEKKPAVDFSKLAEKTKRKKTDKKPQRNSRPVNPDDFDSTVVDDGSYTPANGDWNDVSNGGAQGNQNFANAENRQGSQNSGNKKKSNRKNQNQQSNQNYGNGQGTQNPQGFGNVQDSQGFIDPQVFENVQNPQEFADPQGHGNMQDPQGYMQDPQGFADPQGYGNMQDPQGFADGQGPQDFPNQ